jgi:hypothetical protein
LASGVRTRGGSGLSQRFCTGVEAMRNPGHWLFAVTNTI